MISTSLHFYKTPRLLKNISRDLIWEVPTNEKDIFLTFDDGPIPKLTDYVLETLEAYNAKATFFCVGDNISKFPEICNNVVEKGHRLGNHTFNHLKGWKTDDKLYLENIEKCQDSILAHQITPFKQLFRPPYGQITKNQIKLLKDRFHIIMWDILSYDFEMSHSPQKSLERIIQKTIPGSIVVFHDNYKAEDKIKYMLPRFLDYFKEKDFNFKKIDS